MDRFHFKYVDRHHGCGCTLPSGKEGLMAAHKLPETQIDSFHSLEQKEVKQSQVFEAIKANNGATLFELVQILDWPVNRISGRVSELKRFGLIKDSGTRKTNPESNKPGIVWIVSQTEFKFDEFNQTPAKEYYDQTK